MENVLNTRQIRKLSEQEAVGLAVNNLKEIDERDIIQNSIDKTNCQCTKHKRIKQLLDKRTFLVVKRNIFTYKIPTLKLLL